MAKYVIGLVLAALVFDQLTDQKSELAEAAIALSHLHWGWVMLGVAAEAGSVLAFVQLQRRLLGAGRVDVAIGPMAAITLAANSITNSLPAGPVIATMFSFRQFRRRGADEAVAGWSVAATFVVMSVTLAVVAAIGALAAGAEGASLDLVGVIMAVLFLALAMGAVFAQKRALVWTVSAMVRLCRRLTGWPHDELAADIDRILLRLTVVHLSPGQVVGILWWGWANWMFDCGCLAVSFLAVGGAVPWKGLLLAYGAGQLAANLPITPGGLGVVEGSLTIAIVAYGGVASSTVAAVLLYRVLSFWLTLPFGWWAWTWLARLGRRRPMPAPAGNAGTPDTGTEGAAAAGGLPGGDGDIPQAGGRMTASAPGLLPPLASAGTGRENPCRRPWRHRRPRWRWPHGPLALVMSIAVTAVGLGACGAGRDALGTNAGPCFIALPVAKRAVEGRGSLAGVRLVDVSRFTARNERAMDELLDLLPAPPAHDICLVAYTGSFTPGQVERPLGPPPFGGVGRYAIAVVTTPKPGLLGTFVVRHEPLNFTRAHVGF